MRWLLERTGLNWFEQKALPASVMRGYRTQFRAGHAAAKNEEHGIDAVIRRGW